MDAAVVASIDLRLSYNTANIANWLDNFQVLKVATSWLAQVFNQELSVFN